MSSSTTNESSSRKNSLLDFKKLLAVTYHHEQLPIKPKLTNDFSHINIHKDTYKIDFNPSSEHPEVKTLSSDVMSPSHDSSISNCTALSELEGLSRGFSCENFSKPFDKLPSFNFRFQSDAARRMSLDINKVQSAQSSGERQMPNSPSLTDLAVLQSYRIPHSSNHQPGAIINSTNNTAVKPTSPLTQPTQVQFNLPRPNEQGKDKLRRLESNLYAPINF